MLSFVAECTPQLEIQTSPNFKDLHIEIDKWSTGARVDFLLGDTPIGHAHISMNGSEAELEDFILLARVAHPNLLLRFVGLKWSYRGRGFGSILMPMLIATLCDLGITRLSGTIQPARGTLPGWYRRMGFQVDEGTGRIVMEVRPNGK